MDTNVQDQQDNQVSDTVVAEHNLHDTTDLHETHNLHETTNLQDAKVYYTTPVDEREVSDLGVSPKRVVNQPDDLRITRLQLDKMLSHIKDLMEGRRLTPSLLLRLTANCMLLAQKMNSSSRISKKLVTLSLEEYIKNEASLNEDEVNALMTVFDVVVDTAFDELYTARKMKCCMIM